MYRIAHKEVNNILRKKQPEITKPEWDIFALPQTEVREKESENREMSKKVSKCSRDLPVELREVLVLYYLEDMKYRQISRVLGIPESTVAVRINNGKTKLKEICSEHKE